MAARREISGATGPDVRVNRSSRRKRMIELQRPGAGFTDVVSIIPFFALRFVDALLKLPHRLGSALYGKSQAVRLIPVFRRPTSSIDRGFSPTTARPISQVTWPIG